MAKDVKVGATTGDALAIVIGPIFQTADANLRHEGIETSDSGFELYFSTLGDSALIEEAATAGELASWEHIGGGLYQVILDSARAASARAGRAVIAIVYGDEFYTENSKEIGIVRHEPTALPWCNSSNEQQSTVSPTAGSIQETSFADAAISARVIASAAFALAKFADGCFSAAKFVAGWLTAAAFASDTKFYAFDIDVERDGSTTDEYTATPTYNGLEVPYASLSGLPTLTVIKRADGSTLINSQLMSRIGTTNSFKWNETDEDLLLAASETYLAYLSFNDGTARTPKKKLIKIRVAS